MGTILQAEKSVIKLACFKNHLTFMIKNREKKVFPKRLRVKLPISSNKGDRIVQRASHVVLRECIHQAQRTKVTITQGVKRKLKTMIGPKYYRKVLLWADNAADMVFHQIKVSQMCKLRHLLSEPIEDAKP